MREQNLAHEMATVLMEHRLNVEPEYAVKGGSIDIFVKYPAHNIAIECERLSKTGKIHLREKQGDAVKDTVKRFVNKNSIDIGFAVILPNAKNFKDISANTLIDYAMLRRPDALIIDEQVKSGKLTYKKASQSLGWRSIRIGNFVGVLNSTHEDLGRPELLANNLKNVLNENVNSIPKNVLVKLAKAINSYEKDGDPSIPAKRALLIVGSAAMFHTRLVEHLDGTKPTTDVYTGKKFTMSWPPKNLSDCIDADDVIGQLLESWRRILAIDYKPIFEAARTVLKSSTNPHFNQAVKSVCEWALDAARVTAGRRHDLLGQLFHIVLPYARNDGSYYTTTPAATLLAGLSLRSPDDLPNSLARTSVIDPACGTGTLLMAAANRIKELYGSNWSDEMFKVVIENVLTGIDINHTATHMAATTLGLLEPDVKFKNMKIFKADFGRPSGQKIVKAGSLELHRDTLLNYEGMPSPMTQIDQGHKKVTAIAKNDLVIMNPPYTRHDLRYKQLTKSEVSEIKDRERSIFRNEKQYIDFTSSGPAFIIMSKKLVKDTGCVATVFPASFLRAPSVKNLREFILKVFWIDTIVISHDPARIYFSENTHISEILMIMRPKIKNVVPPPSRIIHIAKNPTTSSDAALMAYEIRSPHITDGQNWHQDDIPQKYVQLDDFAGVNFYSSILTSKFRDLKSSKFFKVETIGNVAEVGYQGRTVSMYFEITNKPKRDSQKTIWYHKTRGPYAVQKMSVEPIVPIVSKSAKNLKSAVFRYNEKKGNLLLPERLRLNRSSLVALRSDTKVLGGSAWTPVFLKNEYALSHNITDNLWSKAMAVWFNSTLGMFSVFAMSIMFELNYAKFAEFDNFIIPKLNTKQICALGRIFDKYHTSSLQKFSTKIDPIREMIDRSLCKILKIDYSVITIIRNELVNEPMLTGSAYSDGSLDSWI